MTDEDCCPQCGFVFMNGELLAEIHFMCPEHGHEVMLIHPGRCFADYLRDIPKQDTRNAMISARRLN